MERAFFHPEFGYWQTNSEVSAEIVAAYPEGTIEVPLRPSPFAEWVGDVWVDQPPPAPIPTLSRVAFCVALIGAGILTEAEATDAAFGAWPAKFEPALAGKALVEKLTIKNLWRETKTVTRDAQLFLDLLAFYAAAMKLTPAQAEALGDEIFAGAAA